MDNDGIKNFLEIDEEIYDDNEHYLNNSYSDLYLLNYQDKDNIFVSYGKLAKLNRYTLSHYCNTNEGSSGSPILSLKTCKVIGVHHGALKNFNINLGTFIKYPIFEFKNTIKSINKLFKNNNVYNNIPFKIKGNKSKNEYQFNQYYNNNINISNKNNILFKKSIEDDIYNIIPCNCINMALDINGCDINKNTNLQIWENNNSVAQ